MTNPNSKKLNNAIRLLRTVHKLNYNIEDKSIQKTILKKFKLTDPLTIEEQQFLEAEIQKIKSKKPRTFPLFTFPRIFYKIYLFFHK